MNGDTVKKWATQTNVFWLYLCPQRLYCRPIICKT